MYNPRDLAEVQRQLNAFEDAVLRRHREREAVDEARLQAVEQFVQTHNERSA